MKILENEIYYRGMYFPMRTVKQQLLSDYDLSEFVIHRSFDPKTGTISRKYPWETVIHAMNTRGLLTISLDKILANEHRDQEEVTL